MKGILRTIHRYHFLSSHPSLGYPTVKNRQGLLAFPTLTAFPFRRGETVANRTEGQIQIRDLQLRDSSGFSPFSLFLFLFNFLNLSYNQIKNLHFFA